MGKTKNKKQNKMKIFGERGEKESKSWVKVWVWLKATGEREGFAERRMD